MSAMDLLKAEINKKRKATSELIEQTGSQKVGRARYVRQGDLMKIEEEKRREAQRKLDAEREAHRAKAQEDEIAKESKVGSGSSGTTSGASSSTANQDEKNPLEVALASISKLDTDEIKQRLRHMGHPVTLYGEVSEERVQRLAFVLSQIRADEDDYRLTGSHSTKNPFLADNRSTSGTGGGSHGTSGGGSGSSSRSSLNALARKLDTLEEEHLDNEDAREGDMSNLEEAGEPGGEKSGKSGSFIKGDIKTQYSSTKGLSEYEIIYKYFRNLLKQWEWDLDDRTDVEKASSKGRIETMTQKQCKDYIRPLFKLCKRKEVPLDILDKLLKIVGFCEEGNFRMAHDIYLRGAIGNSAWPIGLTMVGIHERSGREKISTSKVAHVMNNELQRKYFTSVKRLMTYAQSKRPDVAPSMKSM